MRKVLMLTCLLVVAHYVAAQCNNIPTYNETLIPQCAPNDIRIKWPNYENVTTYYSCKAVNTSVLVNCPDKQYFCYVLQQCVSCANYIPPVQCSELKTQNKPNCVPIGQGGTTSSPTISTGSTYPTPNYPGSSTKEPPTTKPTKPTATPTGAPTATPTGAPTAIPTGAPTAIPTGAPTAKPTVAPTAPTPPTPPTEAPGITSSIPPPPSPVTNNPNIPMPPTPEPTPPSVPVTPPSYPAPPSVG